MINDANVGDVYIHGNLMNNKKTNINTLYLCAFLAEKIHHKYGVFFVPG